MRSETSRFFCVVYIVCIISCILLFSGLMNGVWGSYYTQIEGSATARVAKWDVAVSGTDETQTFNQSGTAVADNATYHFTVTNNSEVAMQYTVKVIFDQAPPANVSLELGSNTIKCDGIKTEYSFPTYVCSIESNGVMDHALYVSIDYTTGGKLVEYSELRRSARIAIVAEQID